MKQLIALRLEEEYYKIMIKRIKELKIKQTDFITSAIMEKCGYKLIPSKIIKIKCKVKEE